MQSIPDRWFVLPIADAPQLRYVVKCADGPVRYSQLQEDAERIARDHNEVQMLRARVKELEAKQEDGKQAPARPADAE